MIYFFSVRSLAHRLAKVRCMCDCETAAREKMARREKEREEMQQLQRLRDSSLIESRLREARLSSFVKTRDNQNLYKMAQRYVEKFEDMYKKSQGILFWGTVGTGKSFTAACIANELLDRRIPVIMTSFVKILVLEPLRRLPHPPGISIHPEGIAHFKDPVIYPLEPGVLRLLHLRERQIRCENQRLSG